MRKIIAILLCKIIRFVGKFVGKGSSLPGKIALKIYPDVLKDINLPKNIIAVTGSNGKTSTVEMIAHVLTDAGKSFAYNKEGSNQIEGVTTFILNNSTLLGKFKKDIILLETDERFAKYTFKYVKPMYYVIMNLYRDQLTRNGHPEWVYNCILESISDDMNLILNANDPLISMFGLERKNVSYFSINRLDISTQNCTSLYNDSKYCPNCFNLLEYDYYHYSDIGKFSCSKCGLKTNKAKFSVTKADLDQKYMVINNKYKIDLAFSNMYSMYNVLAAFSLLVTLGIDEEICAKSLSNYSLKNGRVVNFHIGDCKGTLLTSKHENSVSYDQSIDIVINHKSKVDVLIIVDAVSRKYFTSEVSWLWDINFEKLNHQNIQRIVLSGLYCNDLATRFDYCNIDKEKIKVIDNIENAVEYLKEYASNDIFVITCFSDKAKFLSKVCIDKG